MYILAINGSPNKEGNTAFLLNKVLESSKSLGAEGEVVFLSDALKECKTPFCDDCSKPCSGACYMGTKLEELFDKMRRADAIVLGSPVYFASCSAQIKALFDKSRKLRTEKSLLGKLGAVVAVGHSKYGGQQTTLRAIHDMMMVQGMVIIGDSSSDPDFGMGHHGVGAQNPAREDEYAVKRALALGKQLVNLKI